LAKPPPPLLPYRPNRRLHRYFIILTAINAGYLPNTPTTRHHSVDADDALLVAVVAVTNAEAAVADDHASKQSTLLAQHPNYCSPSPTPRCLLLWSTLTPTTRWLPNTQLLLAITTSRQ
jgi:hypothetical protein